MYTGIHLLVEARGKKVTKCVENVVYVFVCLSRTDIESLYNIVKLAVVQCSSVDSALQYHKASK